MHMTGRRDMQETFIQDKTAAPHEHLPHVRSQNKKVFQVEFTDLLRPCPFLFTPAALDMLKSLQTGLTHASL